MTEDAAPAELVVVHDERTPDVALGIRGELDIATAEVLRREVDQALTAAPATLYLDLSATTFLDSSGCRELLASARSGAAAGSAVELVVPPGDHPVRRVLELLQLDRRVPVRDALPGA